MVGCRVGFHPATGELRAGPGGQAGPQFCWADRVAGLVRDKFSELFQGTTYYKRKVLAGVVVERAGEASVVSLTTGTKCINGAQLSLAGLALNDCHAEVLARRGLVCWLYGQLERALAGQDSAVGPDRERGGFSLLPGTSLHLFISTAPCGDARIYSPAEQSGRVPRPEPPPGESSNRGKLRSKIESGMGTVPLGGVEQLQTWDGVTAGERLLTMACSDKILLWNWVGLGGALLAHWLPPLHLDTITLGSRFHPEHVQRALWGRGQAAGLERSVRQPALLATTSPEPRQASKAQDHSLNWVAGGRAEVVMGATGRTQAGHPSRLCKRALADRFAGLCALPGAVGQARSSLAPLVGSYHIDCGWRYGELKKLAVEHEAGKRELVAALGRAGAGQWVGKPGEQDQFTVAGL